MKSHTELCIARISPICLLRDVAFPLADQCGIFAVLFQDVLLPGKQLVSQPLCKKMFVSCQRTCCRKNLQNKVSFFIEMGEKLSSKYNM